MLTERVQRLLTLRTWKGQRGSEVKILMSNEQPASLEAERTAAHQMSEMGGGGSFQVQCHLLVEVCIHLTVGSGWGPVKKRVLLPSGFLGPRIKKIQFKLK